MNSQKINQPVKVHPTSIVHHDCTLRNGVEIGPFCLIGQNVTIGEGTHLISHITISGSTTLGRNCIVYPNAALGGRPQDVKYNNEPSALIIGDNAVIREGVTISIGTAGGDMVTRIGDRAHIMAGVHVAHDCQIGDNVTLVNGVGLAGHVTVGNGAIVAGMAGVHQWCRIGTLAFVAGGSKVSRDVLPFSVVKGDRARTIGINEVGLRRVGWGDDRISTLQTAMRLYQEHGQVSLVKLAETEHQKGDLVHWLDFAAASRRGLCLSKEAAAHITQESKSKI